MSFSPRLPIPISIAPPSGTGPTLPRREFLRLLSLAAGSAVVLSALPRRAAALAEWVPSFPDGIKSGAPNVRRGVIWTRVAPPPDAHAVPVMWSVAARSR